MPHLLDADFSALPGDRGDHRGDVRACVVVLRPGSAARLASVVRLLAHRALRDRSRAPSAPQRHHAARDRDRVRLQLVHRAGLAGVADRIARRRRRTVRDRGGVLSGAPRGRPRHGRREDAGDDRRVPGMEARAADVDSRVVRRNDHRHPADRDATRRHEVRAAVWRLSRAWRRRRRIGRPRTARLVPRNVLMQLTPSAYAFLGVTALVAALVSLVVFAMLRFSMAARDARRSMRNSASAETAMLSAALQDAVTKLKAQERATAARAEASERMSLEIIAGLTAGLLVVGLEREIRILNPAGRRMLDPPETAPDDFAGRRAAAGGGADLRPTREQPPFDVIDECLASGSAVVRRAVALPDTGHGMTHLGVTVSPLFDHEARLHGAICLFTDLTAVKDLEEQLRLKDSLAAVGELTAGIAH